jgi:hypothetical protein
MKNKKSNNNYNSFSFSFSTILICQQADWAGRPLHGQGNPPPRGPRPNHPAPAPAPTRPPPPKRNPNVPSTLQIVIAPSKLPPPSAPITNIPPALANASSSRPNSRSLDSNPPYNIKSPMQSERKYSQTTPISAKSNTNDLYQSQEDEEDDVEDDESVYDWIANFTDTNNNSMMKHDTSKFKDDKTHKDIDDEVILSFNYIFEKNCPIKFSFFLI